MELLNNQKINYNLKAGVTTGDKIFHICCWLFLVAFFLLPDNFGFYLGMLFSAKRIMLFMCYAFIIFSGKRSNQFWQAIKKCVVLNVCIILFMMVRVITAIWRTDLNSFAYDLLDSVLVFYLFLYIIMYEINFISFQKFVEITVFILCVCGLIEYIFHYNVFNLLNTAKQFITSDSRLSNARVTANCHHSIIFGYYLSMLCFITCIDFNKNKLFLFRRPILYIFSLTIIFMTGSRAPIGLFICGSFLLVFLSDKDHLIKSLIYIAIFLIIFSLIIVATYSTSFAQYILRMVTSAFDGIFGTTLSYQFGGENFSYSTEYRRLLMKVFDLDYFSKFIGQGVSYELSVIVEGSWIRSCDNSYVAIFIAYAYPGLIVFWILMGAFFGYIVVGFIVYKNRAFCAIFVALLSYLFLIKNVAMMGSFMYIMALLAITYVIFYKEKQKNEGKDNAIENYQRRIRH